MSAEKSKAISAASPTQASSIAGAPDALSRQLHIDGLRGVAVCLVVIYHAYVRWPQLAPFGDRFGVPPLAQGWVGVELFFLISGFVIFMTLERSGSYIEFALQRWRRLFPAMLVCTCIIVATAPWLPERPQGAISALNVIPGLTFIDPRWWALLRLDVAAIEGAFWSLFVEVQFYAIAGAVYFIAGRTAAIATLLLR
jgi:peptidoglycan/LPS O-acetylase OafA/YrhL